MVTNNSAKEEGICTSDSKRQVFAAGTPDLETGAKTAARYSKNGEAENTARDLVPAISAPPEVRVENYDAARLKHAFIIRRIVCTLLIPKVALWD